MTILSKANKADVLSDKFEHNYFLCNSIKEAYHYTSYDNISLTPNTLHSYCIRSKNASGTSPWSEMITASTLQALPTGLSATATSTTITLSWPDVASAVSFDVQVDGIVIDNAQALTYVHKGLILVSFKRNCTNNLKNY